MTAWDPEAQRAGRERAAAAASVERGQRTTLRWRLTLVYGGVAAGVGVLLLLIAFALVRSAIETGFVDAPPWLRVELPDGRVTTLGQVQAELRAEALGRLYRQGVLALLALIGLGTAAAWFVAGRVLRPLQDITATAQRLSAEQLDQRIALQGPRDELRELAETFDAMLDRLQASFEAQRRFVADASHELRTPLAVMRTEVDVALADPAATTDDLRRAAEVVRDATVRAAALVDGLLLLARGERLRPDELPATERVLLGEVADAALASVRAEAEEKGVTVAVSSAPAAVSGDRALLERLAGNLVENGVRHNVPGGWLRVDTGVVGTTARLQVSSTGAEVPPEEVEALFEPFRRHGVARTARTGAGLGLAIVRAVATAHGGTATAEARAGGGLVVTVDLPRADQRRGAPSGPDGSS